MKQTTALATNTATTAADKAFETFSQMMADRIQMMLESSSSEWKQPWFSAAGGWPRNIEGRAYSGTNALVLMMLCSEKGYRHPLFATYNAVEALNPEGTPQEKRVHVLKGENSFPVIYSCLWAVERATGQRISIEEYRELSQERQKEHYLRHSIKVYRVFNIAQTNLKEANPELWEKLAGKGLRRGEVELYAPLERMIAGNLWHCPILETDQSVAYYSVSRDEIVLPRRSLFRDGESFALTAFHEMAHSTGHDSRLGRLQGWKDAEDYAREELIAELTAAMVGARHGMQKHLKEDSVAYLRCWLERLKKDSGYIRTILSETTRAAEMIEEGILRAGQAGLGEAA